MDGHTCLKESIMEEGKALLGIITFQQSGIFLHVFILLHISRMHTHNNWIHSETHTSGHNGAPTLFHSLLIFGLTDWPSKRRPHMNVAERETGRDKDKEWDESSEKENKNSRQGKKYAVYSNGIFFLTLWSWGGEKRVSKEKECERCCFQMPAHW